jgi:hypothetical protein
VCTTAVGQRRDLLDRFVQQIRAPGEHIHANPDPSSAPLTNQHA